MDPKVSMKIKLVSLFLATLVCLFIMFLKVLPEFKYAGTSQVFEEECWIPAKPTIYTNESDWREITEKNKEHRHYYNCRPEEYRELVGDEEGHQVLIQKGRILYSVVSGKSVFATGKELSFPKFGLIKKVNYANNGNIEWIVEFNSISSTNSALYGLVIGIFAGSLAFFFFRFMIELTVASIALRKSSE